MLRFRDAVVCRSKLKCIHNRLPTRCLPTRFQAASKSLCNCPTAEPACPFCPLGTRSNTDDTTCLQLPYAAQKDMLEDHKRTGAYYNAVLQNRRQFAGKVRQQHVSAASLACRPCCNSERVGSEVRRRMHCTVI